MEIAIAIGLGAWFAFTGAVSCIAVFRSFKKEEKGDDK